MKENFNSIEMSVLMDRLAEHTASYTRFLAKGGTKVDIEDCEKTILQLQTEIERRKENSREVSSLQNQQ